MATFLIPFFAFLSVMLIMLMVYGAWGHFFGRRNQAKKKRLQSIYNTLHWGGQILGSAQATQQDSAVETWLRSRFRTFEKLEKLTQRAHSSFTAGRLTGLMLALFTVVVVLGFLRQTNPLLLLVLAVAIASMPVLWLSRRSNKRRQAFGDKLPETLDYISRTLLAGHSLSSAIGMVGKEFADPIGYEFKKVFDEMGFGIPFKDAIDHLAERVQSYDLNFLVISLKIQHETGGNLTELLDGLAKTMRERIKLRGKIRTLTSEGRASAWILGSMPLVLIAIFGFISPGYMSVFWTTSQGHTLLLICVGLMTVGLFLLNHITRIKV